MKYPQIGKYRVAINWIGKSRAMQIKSFPHVGWSNGDWVGLFFAIVSPIAKATIKKGCAVKIKKPAYIQVLNCPDTSVIDEFASILSTLPCFTSAKHSVSSGLP